MIDKAGRNAKVHYSVRAYGKNVIGNNTILLENVCIGYPTSDILLEISKKHLDFTYAKFNGCAIGSNVIIRSNSVVYCNVKIGNDVRTGHGVLVRENCTIGNNVLIGTNTVIENNCKIGNHVSIQSSVFIPSRTIIGNYVFIGPLVTMTNDKYPIRIKKAQYKGPVLEDGVSLCAGCVILPEVVVGKGSMIASNAVVTRDVPKWHLAVGIPARFIPLNKKIKKINKII